MRRVAKHIVKIVIMSGIIYGAVILKGVAR